MNREIKFRAWNKINKTMYTGLPYSKAKGEDDFVTVLKYPQVYEIMEYTGLKDRNGKEIYEGDIDKYGYVVTYVADINESLGMNCGWYLQRNDFESWSPLECDSDEIEIIGNIFETPKLAKL